MSTTAPFNLQEATEQQTFYDLQGFGNGFQEQINPYARWGMAGSSDGHNGSAPWPGGYGDFTRAATGESSDSLVDYGGTSQDFDGSAGNPSQLSASSHFQPRYHPAPQPNPNNEIHTHPQATSSSSTTNAGTSSQPHISKSDHVGPGQKRLAPYTSTKRTRRSTHNKACLTCQGGSCSGHSRSALEPLLPPVPVGLIGQQPSLGASTHHKLLLDLFELIESAFNDQAWFKGIGRSEEPTIEDDDYFVTSELIQKSQKSRFFALIYLDPDTGYYHCRIPHKIKKKGEHLDCIYQTLQSKDAIAHVRDCLGYKAYKCSGRDRHQACGQYFLTRERCNDHLSKKNREKEPMVQCDKCTAKPMLQRNLPRHLEMKHSEAQ
ncbi:hypothetical protein M408DRAFT_21621 [Serendipita vermifera MAFF 305830]|uniref:Uncharacterized protein n=1 Tax=Serendipita vermifera MAFF 305830 TaxID=933852 RepID=A0A0C3BH41_SERVB|nr:hypothetical protein M408DRAFT_21621 [Serendipita vermifera MAFF 305830]